MYNDATSNGKVSQNKAGYYAPQTYQDADACSEVRQSSVNDNTASSGTWSYGLGLCCGDCSSCLEAWCCTSCQVSRQYNMLVNGKPEIHWPLCLAVECIDDDVCTCMTLLHVRGLVRERYGMPEGDKCSDCFASFCCQPCLVQQILMEMTVHGDFPGASCYSAPSAMQPSKSEMV